jgi:hypothetical protein
VTCQFVRWREVNKIFRGWYVQPSSVKGDKYLQEELISARSMCAAPKMFGMIQYSLSTLVRPQCVH